MLPTTPGRCFPPTLALALTLSNWTAEGAASCSMLRALAARYARQAGCTLAPTTQPRLFGTLHRRTGRTQAQEERRRSLDDVLRDTDHVELLSSLPDAPLALQVRRGRCDSATTFEWPEPHRLGDSA